MNKLNYSILFILILLLYSCGTGPWYIQKNIYETYKEPIYKNSNRNLKTNGYYEKLTDSSENDSSKNVDLFDEGEVTGTITKMNIVGHNNYIKIYFDNLHKKTDNCT